MIHINVLGKPWEYELRGRVVMGGHDHDSGIDYDERRMVVRDGLSKRHTAELTADLMARAFSHEYQIHEPLPSSVEQRAIPVWKTTENGE